MSSEGSSIFTAEYRLNAIILMLQKHDIVFSKTEASRLLGGRGRLCADHVKCFTLKVSEYEGISV